MPIGYPYGILKSYFKKLRDTAIDIDNENLVLYNVIIIIPLHMLSAKNCVLKYISYILIMTFTVNQSH